MKGVPKSLSQKDAEELFKKIRTAMNVKEGFNMWEIAPKFDWKGLRDNYVQEKIYRVGLPVILIKIGKVISSAKFHRDRSLICDQIIY